MIAGQTAGGQQPHQPKNMIAMHMANKNSADLTRLQLTFEKLVLGALTTVK
jgi:hypothetical protein